MLSCSKSLFSYFCLVIKKVYLVTFVQLLKSLFSYFCLVTQKSLFSYFWLVTKKVYLVTFG